MLKSKEVIGLPVLTINDGTQVGKITDIIVDNQKRKVVALELSEKSGLFKKTENYITIENVYNIGTDAVTVEKLDFNQDISKEFSNFRISNLVGRKLILEDGTNVGKLGGINFKFPQGELTSISITDNKNSIFGEDKGNVDISRIRAIGKDAIIIYDK